MALILLPIDPIALIAIILMVIIPIIFVMKKYMITYALIVTNFVIFFISLIFPQSILGGTNLLLNAGLGFRPLYLQPELLPNSYTLFTSMFVHAGFLHIIGNMLVFFFMGVAFEQRIGWKKFLLIYLVTGVCGALTHSLLNLSSPNNLIALVGASGAIFGILGAFAAAYPWDEVVMPIPIGIMIITKTKVLYAAIIFAAMETLIVFLSVSDGTAHFAHFGGLISGVVLAMLFIRRKKQDDSFTQKTRTPYDSFVEPKTKRINFDTLKNLAKTPEQQEMLSRIQNETVPQVQDIWLEHFIEKSSCPTCGKPLYHLNRKIWCEDCGFRTSY
ncbi:MAG: rhomboid family intramembrane serine protease [Methanobacteriota archaeon]